MKISLPNGTEITQIDIYPNIISVEISTDFNSSLDLILPATFASSSMRVNYALSIGIHSVNIIDLSMTNLDIKFDAEFENDIEKLAMDIDNLEGEISSLNFSIHYLDKVKPSLSDTDAVDKELEHFMKLKSSSVTQLAKLERDINYKKSIFETLITDRQKLYPSGYNKSIKIQATGDENAKLVFSISSSNIKWSSHYRLGLNSSTGSIEVNQYLNIVQKTMLDLSGEMTLHFATTIYRNINTTLLTETVDIEAPREKTTIILASRRSDIQEEMCDMESVEPMATKKKMRGTAIVETISELVGVKIKLDINLPSHLLPENILIDKYTVGSKIEILIIPSLYEFAILNVEIVDLSKPIYSGKAELYIDDVYTSNQYLETALIGGKIKIPFGLLESISSKREDLITKRDDGLLKDYSDFAYNIKINNFNNDIKDVKIIDRIPISRHGSLKVTDIDISSEGSISDRGIIEWELLLQPNHEIELDVKYKLKFPKGVSIIRR